MLALAVQFSAGHHPKHGNLVGPALTLVVTAVLGSLLLGLLKRIVPPCRRRLRARIARKRRIRAAATAELRARAMMDELCPHGWQAQILLYSSADELPREAPDPTRTRVQLDWAELSEPTVIRRVWAPSVSLALEAMVADRITDDTLQQIEHQALADGATWLDY